MFKEIGADSLHRSNLAERRQRCAHSGFGVEEERVNGRKHTRRLTNLSEMRRSGTESPSENKTG
jgi:hypothetical protein